MAHFFILFFLLFCIPIRTESFFDRFFSSKEKIEPNSVQQRESDFSSLNYKPIVQGLKKYHPHYASLNDSLIKLNQALYCMNYLDRGAVQVFYPQKRLRDFQAIKEASCAIKSEIYTDWFLNKDSFFIRCANCISEIRARYMLIKDVQQLFENVEFANKNVLAELAEPTQVINKQFETETKKVLETQQNVSRDVINNQQDKIATAEQFITKKNQEITSLQEQITALEKDTEDWKLDLLNFEALHQADEEVAQKDQLLREENDKAVSEINNRQRQLSDDIEKIEEEIKGYEQSISEAEQINAVIKNIQNYNEKKQKDLDKQKNKNFFERTRDTFFEPEDLVKQRTDILNAVHTLNVNEKLAKVSTFDEQKFFKTEFIQVLQNNTNKDLLENQKDTAKENITLLKKEDKELDIKKKEAENVFLKKKKSNFEKPAALEKNYKHDLIRERTEKKTIESAIENNTVKINQFKIEIEKVNKEIKQKQEEIEELNRIITTTKTESPKNITESSAQLIQKHLEALKNMNVSTAVESYSATLLNFSKSESSTKKSSSTIFSMISDLQLLRLDLSYICNIPMYQSNITMQSLTANYTEELGTSEALKYKASELKQEASEKFAALATAFAQKKKELLNQSTEQKVIKKTTEKSNPDNTIYCTIEQYIIDTIKIKMSAILQDIEQMIEHTLLLAQTIDTDYYKLIAIKDMLFIPLCIEYEQFKKIVARWITPEEYSKYGSENFDIKNIKKEYSNLLIAHQSTREPKDFLFKEKETEVVANNFFTAFAKNIEQKIRVLDFKKDEKKDESWFKTAYKKIYQYEQALKLCNTTQLRWYPLSKETTALFTKIQKVLIEKKADIANIATPLESELSAIITESNKDLFLKPTQKTDGKLPQTIKQIVTIKKSLLQSLLLFNTKNKQSLQQTKSSELQEFRTKINSIITYARNQVAKTGNNIYQQIVNPLYKEIIAYAEQLLLNIPND